MSEEIDMFLTLIDRTHERELARATLLRTKHDKNDVEAMAALGRKLVTWIEETEVEVEEHRAKMRRLCNCSDQKRAADAPAKGLHSLLSAARCSIPRRATGSSLVVLKTTPTEETLKRFPGLVALQVVYEEHVYGCTKCELHEGRTKIVFGHGASECPPIAFVGEAPGKDEDSCGYPFVGESGKLLDRMIEAMGLAREDLYALNTVACRPPGNRNPSRDEQAACWPVMASQLKAVRPKTIVCLGGMAARSLLQTELSVGDLRRKWHAWEGIPVRVTYHPSYLLRSPDMKTRAWSDLQAVMEKVK